MDFGAVADGVADDTAAIQAAINAAVGAGNLLFPDGTYKISAALLVPSNTHLIIAAGATIRLADGAFQSCFFINANASNVLIDLFGTLDGNAYGQYPFTATGTASGGIVNGRPISDVLIDGHRQGVITNFYHWGVNIVGATNTEVRGVAITDCGNSPEFAGFTTRHNVISGSYDAGSGAMTLTSDAAHGINAGDTFTYVAAASAQSYLQGEFIATAVTSTSVTCTAPTGLPGGPGWSGAAGTQGRIGTCTKCYNVGFVDCTVRDTRDIPLCFYGGVVGGYIRNCDLDAGPSIFSDVGQPGSNIDCEISGCYTHDGNGGGPSVVSSQAFVYQHNCRVYDNIVRNMARGGIALGYCDGVDVYGNSLHNNAPQFQGSSQQSGQIVVSDGTIKANIWGNTIRDPGQGATAQQIIRLTSATYNNSTGVVTLILPSTPSPVLNVGDQLITFNMFGQGNYLALNGTWTAITGTTGSTVAYQAPAGLGAITIVVTSTAGPAVIITTLAINSQIAAGSYSSDTSGNISLQTTAAHNILVGDAFVLSGVFGSTSGGILTGLHTATAGTIGTTLNFVTTPSLASFPVTAGNVWPANFGISIASPDYCRIAGNRIGDYQKPALMTACIGGTWGLTGASDGNYFGPRRDPDPDVSLYDSGVNGFNYDLLFGTIVTNSSIDGQVTFRGSTQLSSAPSATYPPQGLTIARNRNSGRGEVDFLLGQGAGAPGGVDFLQVAGDGTVNTSVGVAGSLLANDGYGNTRLGGALVHGAMQTAALVNAGTVTVNPSTSMVLVRNASSIATAAVVLPAPLAGQYAIGAELELNFQSLIGTLTVTAAAGATVVNPPTAIAVAGASASFINSGTVWLRRIAI